MSDSTEENKALQKIVDALVPQSTKLQQENQRLREKLTEISRGEGRFSMNHLRHAENTIEDMKALAEEALAPEEKNRFCGTCGENDKSIPPNCEDYGTCAEIGLQVYSWNPACDKWKPRGEEDEPS